jgi:hypothetical protein
MGPGEYLPDRTEGITRIEGPSVTRLRSPVTQLPPPILPTLRPLLLP